MVLFVANEASLGNDEDKGLAGLLDDSKGKIVFLVNLLYLEPL